MTRLWPFSLALLLHVAVAVALWRGVQVRAPLTPETPIQSYLASVAEPAPAPRVKPPTPVPPPVMEPSPAPVVKTAKPAPPDRSRELRQQLDLESQLQAEEQARQDKARAEAATKTREEAARRLREQLLQEDLQSQTQRETARRNEATELMARSVQQIKQKVSRHWSAAQVKPDLRCQVRVRLDTAGNVLRVTVSKSSGNSGFDSGVENAIYGASPLPLPNRPDLYSEFKEITFYFSAQDL